MGLADRMAKRQGEKDPQVSRSKLFSFGLLSKSKTDIKSGSFTEQLPESQLQDSLQGNLENEYDDESGQQMSQGSKSSGWGKIRSVFKGMNPKSPFKMPAGIFSSQRNESTSSQQGQPAPSQASSSQTQQPGTSTYSGLQNQPSASGHSGFSRPSGTPPLPPKPAAATPNMPSSGQVAAPPPPTLQRSMSPSMGAPQVAATTSAATAAVNETSVRNMMQRINVLESQVQEVDELKRQLALEQRTGLEWKEKWNYQNFKLNLMVDMLVLRVLELDRTSTLSGMNRPATQTFQQPPSSNSTQLSTTAVTNSSKVTQPYNTIEREGGPIALKKAPQYVLQADLIEDSIEDF
ncbi:hypothetical protein CEUSTIGMA_g11753.t1 [Chlamydomonas eustigma]|uniref:Uncharacterized protein n=1 Tax=Chlamydomonas eustigma TaxID=1157962 RepID=A0A250XMK2_9CHLO|nr:hypothetical protein CEUSTIGMA_g11753.t1 [Chlamydomonas eustigma]|eukprot:GAX84331.1 hypothetical protein CEUSTIGMA_g11753.t1 [Chlamydomonas eustigma]